MIKTTQQKDIKLSEHYKSAAASIYKDYRFIFDDKTLGKVSDLQLENLHEKINFLLEIIEKKGLQQTNTNNTNFNYVEDFLERYQ